MCSQEFLMVLFWVVCVVKNSLWYCFIALSQKEESTKKATEHSMWNEIDWRYMTEESDLEDLGSIVRHPLPWRSTSMSYTCMYVK